MVRNYKRKANRRPESERGLGIEVVNRRHPDVELLARLIVDLAMSDPQRTPPPVVEAQDNGVDGSPERS